MENVPSFELRAGALRLALRPDLGGAIAGLWHHGEPVLRSVEPASLSGPRSGGSFALVPYSNRLGHRRFRWKGRDYRTAANFETSPHSLHGVGWRRAWRIESSSAAEIVLALDHAADDDWPFAFAARQWIALTPTSLRLTLEVSNTASLEQPVGLGWHPYFPRRARSRLHIDCSDRWDPDAQELPVRKVAQPGIDADVEHLAFDHCFEGWRGAARLRDEAFSISLTSSLDKLVVFTPRERDYFCVEPVSHVSNAIHMADPLAHGLVALAPGDRVDAWMQLDITSLR